MDKQSLIASIPARFRDDQAPCATCGELWPVLLLDGKPKAGANPETANFDRLEGPCCYGEGYCAP